MDGHRLRFYCNHQRNTKDQSIIPAYQYCRFKLLKWPKNTDRVFASANDRCSIRWQLWLNVKLSVLYEKQSFSNLVCFFPKNLNTIESCREICGVLENAFTVKTKIIWGRSRSIICWMSQTKPKHPNKTPIVYNTFAWTKNVDENIWVLLNPNAYMVLTIETSAIKSNWRFLEMTYTEAFKLVLRTIPDFIFWNISLGTAKWEFPIKFDGKKINKIKDNGKS